MCTVSMSSDGVDAAGDVDDVRVGEGAHHLADRVGLADVREELVAQALALAGALDDAGDVDEGHRGGHDPLAPEEVREHGQPVVGQRDDADVGLDRRERVVRGEDVGLGQRVEQGGLADVGEADDPDGESHEVRSLPAHRREHVLDQPPERVRDLAGLQRAGQRGRVPRLPAGAGPEEAVQLLDRRCGRAARAGAAGAPGRRARPRRRSPGRVRRARRRAARPRSSCSSVGHADREAGRLEVPRPQGPPEEGFLGRVVQARERDAEPGRPVPLDVPPHVRRAAHRHERHAAAPRSTPRPRPRPAGPGRR